MENVKKFIHNKKDKEVIKKLSKSPSTMRKLVRVYNALCRDCKRKKLMLMRRGKNLGVDDLCDKCKESVDKIMGGKV